MVQMIPVGSSARRAAQLARLGSPLAWLASACRQLFMPRLHRR